MGEPHIVRRRRCVCVRTLRLPAAQPGGASCVCSVSCARGAWRSARGGQQFTGVVFGVLARAPKNPKFCCKRTGRNEKERTKCHDCVCERELVFVVVVAKVEGVSIFCACCTGVLRPRTGEGPPRSFVPSGHPRPVTAGRIATGLSSAGGRALFSPPGFPPTHPTPTPHRGRGGLSNHTTVSYTQTHFRLSANTVGSTLLCVHAARACLCLQQIVFWFVNALCVPTLK